MYDILLVEDNEAIQQINKELFEGEGGYNVRLAMNIAEARDSITESEPSLIVLDIMLPDGNGLDFLREIRRQGLDIPILLLTALAESDDEVRGIREGGDDYIAKPYDSEVLLVRIGNLLNRRQKANERVKEAVTQVKAAADIVEYGPLTINNITQRVSLNGEDVNLGPKEFLLLNYFLKNTDKKLTAEELYEAVWGLDANSSVDVVRVRIKDLRKKLKMDDEVAVIIETEERKYYVCRLCAGDGIL
ncbi:MAG: response regulator transcription factor [Defluviitaleaceae bacterium]|nr:response regulator transcription factor [Defluviitaleaceae bacterium]